jgi:hypothetical protein
LIHVGRLADIGPQKESGDAELFGDSAAPGLVIVDNRDASALGGKEPGAGFANPGSRTP